MSPEMEYFVLFFLTKLEKFKLSKKKLVRANMQSEFCSNKSSTVHTVPVMHKQRQKKKTNKRKKIMES